MKREDFEKLTKIMINKLGIVIEDDPIPAEDHQTEEAYQEPEYDEENTPPEEDYQEPDYDTTPQEDYPEVFTREAQPVIRYQTAHPYQYNDPGPINEIPEKPEQQLHDNIPEEPDFSTFYNNSSDEEPPASIINILQIKTPSEEDSD